MGNHREGNLLISLQEGDTTEMVMLAISRGHVTVAEPDDAPHTVRGGQELAQLVLGTEEADEVIEMAHIQCTGDARKLLSVLFPKQYPQMGNQAL